MRDLLLIKFFIEMYSSNSNTFTSYLVGQGKAPFWLGTKVSESVNSSVSSGLCQYVSESATAERTSCSRKMTGVCTKTTDT